MPGDKLAGLADEYGAEVRIDWEHYLIHQGRHFFLSGFETENAAGTIVFSVTTPNSHVRVHMTFEFEGTSRTEFYIYKAATVTGGATATPINSNQNSDLTSGCTIKKDPTISVAGTLIHSESRGLEGDNKIGATGGQNEREHEIELAPNVTYVFKIISQDNGNIISYMGTWYEIEEE